MQKFRIKQERRKNIRSVSWKVSVKEGKINQKKQQQQQKKSFRFSGSFFQTFPVHFSWP